MVGENKIRLLLAVLLAALVIAPVLAQENESIEPAAAAADSMEAAIPPPLPPSNVNVLDAPNDQGHAILVTWDLSPDDGQGRNIVTAYEIFRFDYGSGERVKRGTVGRGTTEFIDRGSPSPDSPDYIEIGRTLFYTVRAQSDVAGSSEFAPLAKGAAKANWYHRGKTNIAVAILIFTGLLVYFIVSARKGKELYVRELAGISAVDEAIGRATEMGRPILFILGTGTAADIATIAGFTILSRVAKKTAEYQTPVLVPVNDPVILAVAQETVRAAYLEAGRPDIYNPDNVFYVTAMQFPYVAAVNGIMLREKTATNFYMGVFHAESLILAETGNIAGSIQISGTDQVAQLPFFVAATDYTLIGEELYAASAYLSREPVQIGTLKAQDYFKALVMILLVLGLVTMTFNIDFILNLVTTNI